VTFKSHDLVTFGLHTIDDSVKVSLQSISKAIVTCVTQLFDQLIMLPDKQLQTISAPSLSKQASIYSITQLFNAMHFSTLTNSAVQIHPEAVVVSQISRREMNVREILTVTWQWRRSIGSCEADEVHSADAGEGCDRDGHCGSSSATTPPGSWPATNGFVLLTVNRSKQHPFKTILKLLVMRLTCNVCR
jgi:hypothetical protein